MLTQYTGSFSIDLSQKVAAFYEPSTNLMNYTTKDSALARSLSNT